TNKFYGNMLVKSQDFGIWTHPYSIYYVKNNAGLGVMYQDRSQFVYSPEYNSVGARRYFFVPVRTPQIIFQAVEISTSASQFVLKNPAMMSVECHLVSTAGFNQTMQLYAVQGMGLATTKYKNVTPRIISRFAIRSLTAGPIVNGTISSYFVNVDNGAASNWVLYAFVPPGATNAGELVDLKLIGQDILASKQYEEVILQVGAIPPGGDARVYDQAAGSYATWVTTYGEYGGGSGVVKLQYYGEKNERPNVLQFALPHHMQLFDAETHSHATALELYSTSKGRMRGYIGNELTMTSVLPNRGNMYFLPRSSSSESSIDPPIVNLPEAVKSKIYETLQTETGFVSVYYAGKCADKYAYLMLDAKFVLQDDTLASKIAAGVKKVFNGWISNTMISPLRYETVYGGIINGAQVSQPGFDFGNAYYNDHQFHYGYFVHAAASLGLVDPDWAADRRNRQWVDALVRDFSNPNEDDTLFPVSRSFDWFHGHSWAQGTFESADGKDQESSSEDYNSALGLMLWGIITGDSSMEHRAAMMLAIMEKSMNSYFLYDSSNTVEPEAFIPNKVAGILFENKIDHATWFGDKIEYIQGIHMIPLTPASLYVRKAAFVQQEWDTWFAPNNYIDSVQSGWTGILYQNLALTNPAASYNFFANTPYNRKYIDQGCSWTHSLVWAA
ncbi:glycoside hydrolase family 81 protein, partial [Tortispora caseinolytica NRRL Y-17796]